MHSPSQLVPHPPWNGCRFEQASARVSNRAAEWWFTISRRSILPAVPVTGSHLHQTDNSGDPHG